MVGVEEEEMKWNEEKRGRVGKIVHSVFSCLVEYSWLLQTLWVSRLLMIARDGRNTNYTKTLWSDLQQVGKYKLKLSCSSVFMSVMKMSGRHDAVGWTEYWEDVIKVKKKREMTWFAWHFVEVQQLFQTFFCNTQRHSLSDELWYWFTNSQHLRTC